MPRRKSPATIAVSAFEAHPLATLVLDAALLVVDANAAARAVLRPIAGESLGDALGCGEAGIARGRCGSAARCAGCAFRALAERAVAGTAGRARGFVLRTGAGGAPSDLHLLAFAAPLRRGRARGAVLSFADVSELVLDPALLHVCAGCGRVRDDEGEWHPLHRYIEDRLGLESPGALCGACSGGARG